MKHVLLAIGMACALAFGSVSVHGAKVSPSGTIALATATPTLGQYVSFTTTCSNCPSNPKESPRIQVLCYQDVPFDYTDSNGDVHTQTDPLVFGMAGPADQTLLLGGEASVWLWHGGPAHCRADLFFWSYQGGQQFNLLASVEFDAQG